MASVSSKRKPGVYIAWKTVTYRSVLLIVLAVALVFGVAMHFAFPQFTDNTVKAAGNMTTSMLERIAGMAPPPDKSSSGTEKQARFTALEGTVKIKKSSSSTWINADYNIPLEKGDVVQTGSEGMAKVVFHDGTNYTVKQDSLIVIEENLANDRQQTEVKVAVTTGTVDLSTAAYSQGSKSQVSVAGANVSIGPESAAMVHNDPKNDQHEVLVKKGSGEVSRNGETVHLLDYERASFKAKSEKMAKTKEIGPPTPISPANMIPLFLGGGAQTKDVQFTWTAMTSAAGYRLRISRNPYFSSTIVDKPVNAADVTVTGLAPGAYYWMVQSLDAERQVIDGEREEPFHDPAQGEGRGGGRPPDRTEPAWPRHRGDRQDRNRGTRHGQRARSSNGDQRWKFSLFHSPFAGRREHYHGDGAEFQGRSEYQAGEGRNSVGLPRGI